jgi:acetoin utilization protein AcuB
MLVKDYMTRHPLMAEPTMSIVEAQRFMAQNRIRHLPIVGDGKRLLGLVTPQSFMVDPGRVGSLDVWEITRYLSGLTVKEVMIKAKEVVTVGPDLTIEQAARVMVEKKVGSLPVLDGDVLVGILTDIDLLAHLTDMLATRTPGVRATVRMSNNKPGELAKLVSAVAAQGWGIEALGGAVSPKDPDKWDAVIKLRGVPRDKVVAVLSQVADQQIVDVREV